MTCIHNFRKQYNDVIDRHLFYNRAAKFGVKYVENKSKTLRETNIKKVIYSNCFKSTLFKNSWIS